MLSWAHIGLAGSFGALFVGWFVGGCGARAVSRRTPIYFILSVCSLHESSREGKMTLQLLEFYKVQIVPFVYRHHK